jgi:hypothetical protein
MAVWHTHFYKHSLNNSAQRTTHNTQRHSTRHTHHLHIRRVHRLKHGTRAGNYTLHTKECAAVPPRGKFATYLAKGKGQWRACNSGVWCRKPAWLAWACAASADEGMHMGARRRVGGMHQSTRDRCPSVGIGPAPCQQHIRRVRGECGLAAAGTCVREGGSGRFGV